MRANRWLLLLLALSLVWCSQIHLRIRGLIHLNGPALIWTSSKLNRRQRDRNLWLLLCWPLIPIRGHLGLHSGGWPSISRSHLLLANARLGIAQALPWSSPISFLSHVDIPLSRWRLRNVAILSRILSSKSHWLLRHCLRLPKPSGRPYRWALMIECTVVVLVLKLMGHLLYKLISIYHFVGSISDIVDLTCRWSHDF